MPSKVNLTPRQQEGREGIERLNATYGKPPVHGRTQSAGGGQTNTIVYGQTGYQQQRSLIGSGGNPAPVEPKFHGRESTRDPFFDPNTSGLNASLANQGMQSRAALERRNQSTQARAIDRRNFTQRQHEYNTGMAQQQQQFNVNASLERERLAAEREGRAKDRELAKYQTDTSASVSRDSTQANMVNTRVASMFGAFGNFGVR